MTFYQNYFRESLNQIYSEGRYRDFVEISRVVGSFPQVKNSSGKLITMWCSNDYLGMSQHPKVIDAAIEAIKNHGVGSGGTRNISGNSNQIVKLEYQLANLHKKEQAIVFSSGYVANDTTLSALAKIIPNLVYFSDEANHASIIAGIRNSQSEKKIYRHLDMQHLEELLKLVSFETPKVIVFESVYSMDGLASDLEQICFLAKKYNALTYIDEVHTIGLMGHGGSGYANMKGLDDKIDIVQATLSKAYGTVGGYIVGESIIIDAIRSVAPGFIFTTSLPPAIIAAARASIEYLRNSEAERIQHKLVVEKVKSALKFKGINYLFNQSHIIPIMIKDAKYAQKISKILFDKYDIYAQHINFPTVPRGTERLRITPTPAHTDEMIEKLVNSLSQIFQNLNIIN